MNDEAKFDQKHRGGLAWFDAPIPPEDHVCAWQSKGYTSTFDQVFRCACGATNDGGDIWLERNSRARDLQHVVEDEDIRDWQKGTFEDCTYEIIWTDEVGDIPVCMVHNNNSRHTDSDDPHRPCLTIDPYPSADTNELDEQLKNITDKILSGVASPNELRNYLSMGTESYGRQDWMESETQGYSPSVKLLIKLFAIALIITFVVIFIGVGLAS